MCVCSKPELLVQVRINDVFGSLPEEQRWPCWSMLMFNLSDTPDTNCKVTPYLQQLFEVVSAVPPGAISIPSDACEATAPPPAAEPPAANM